VTTAPPSWLPTDSFGRLDDTLGIRIIDFDPDRVVATMPVEANQQPFGLLHGGATSALVEAIGSLAAVLGVGPERTAVGIELNATYVKAATSGVVTAVCTPVRRGRTLATFVIEVTDDQCSTTASARLTCMILPA